MTATPRVSPHARQRCQEMGISTKRAKRVVMRPDIVRPANRPGRPKGAYKMAVSDADPEIAVVFIETRCDRPVIVTVLWRTYETYDRATYRPNGTHPVGE
jgi:hypothetical protein